MSADAKLAVVAISGNSLIREAGSGGTLIVPD